ncbi:hypothetical protein MMC20_000721 [Loxospora ochrophaea]|nr:hypothetical protein [Loxospora ochrophaea]
MATYEIEHSLPPPPSSSTPSASPQRPRRPDLSTFFSTLSTIDTSTTTNTHALPIPADVSAAFRTLAEAFERMRQDGSAGTEINAGGEEEAEEEESGGGYAALLGGLVSQLLSEAEMPPREVRGVSEEWMADPYPLIVRLPCHPTHIFDLECIQPWLKLHPTCPLDRVDLLRKKEPVVEKGEGDRGGEGGEEEEEEEEWDDMYA